MVHLNELHEKYKEKGLAVVAITNEARSAVDTFIEKNTPAYPIVIESSDSLREYQSHSFPTIVLIGADGRILSTDNPSEQTIESALENVRLLPEFPDSFSAVRKAMQKDKYADAIKKADKLVEGGKLSDEELAAGREILAWLTWFGESSFEGAVKDKGAGEIYMAWQALDYLSDAFKGHEIGDKAKVEVDAIMKDKAMKLEVKAGEMLADIRKEVADASTPKSALKSLKPLLSKKYAETKAGKEAHALAEKLETEANK